MKLCSCIPVFAAGVAAIGFGACGGDETLQPPVAPPGPNHAPTITAIPDTSMILGDTLRVRVQASDPDGDPLEYQVTPLLRDATEAGYVADAHIDARTGEFWFVPGGRDMPDRSILFTVTDDGGYFASTQFSVGVSYYVDQSSLALGLGSNVRSYAPMGQEFTPGYDALDVVELNLRGYSATTGTFVVRVREGTITGPVLAVSDTLALPGRFNGSAAFRFNRVTLVPQQTYVMEITQLLGQDFLCENSGGAASVYPYGRLILAGQPKENQDIWFKEGMTSPGPPNVSTFRFSSGPE